MNEDWLNWTEHNLQRGCDPSEIRGILKKNGFADGEIDEAMQRGAINNASPSVNTDARAPKRSFWQKLKSLGEKRPSEQTIESRASQDASNEYKNSRGEIIPENGIQPGLDYLRLSKPNLLNNSELEQIQVEGLQLFVLDDFMTKSECDAIIAQMKKDLRPSTITTGTDYAAFRTSTTCDLGHQSSKIVEKIDKKIARTLGVRLSWSEVIQGQKYEVGQEFKAHTDYFEPGSPEFRKFAGDMGQRTWTFMVYLNETPKGGATYFTKADKMFYPKRGRAVIWNNLKPDGSPNPLTIHHGMPVEEGSKMIITKWFRDKGPGDPLFARNKH